MAKIVVVGSANTDMTIRSEKIPAPGETVVGGVFASAPGGKGANQAVAAARAGGAVTFVARVGADSLGEEAIKGYERDGIDVSKIVRDPANATGVALIMVDASGQNSISVASGANFALSPEDVEAASDAIQNADVVVCQLETPIPTVERAAQLAADAGVPFILDPAPAPSAPLPESLLKLTTIVKPNELEASALTGIAVTDEASARAAAEKLARRAPSWRRATANGRRVLRGPRTPSIRPPPATRGPAPLPWRLRKDVLRKTPPNSRRKRRRLA